MADAGRTSDGSPIGGRRIGRLTSRAQEYVRDPQRLLRLVDDAAQASKSPRSGRMGEALEDLKSVIRMLLAYTRGEYRDIPRDKLLLAVGAIAYFISPIDIIPDFLGPLGLTDDAVVLTFLFRAMREEVDTFLAWEADHRNPPAVEVIDVTTNGRRDAQER